MRKYISLLSPALILSFFVSAQTKTIDSLRKAKDNALKAAIHADSLKIEKEFLEKEKEEILISKVEYPLIKGGKFSGIIPVKDPTEIPDPTIDYKLLFELTYDNPDSLAKEINGGLTEITRIINLHYASGIPLKRIFPVIIVHGAALDAIRNDQSYQKKYKTGNPSIQLINELENKVGAKFIACGQAMTFFAVNKEDLLPDVKVSLTAQTVLSHYQLKGYVLYSINEVK